jgi:hypothetical protein
VGRHRFSGGNEGHMAALQFLVSMVCERANGNAEQRWRLAALLTRQTEGGRPPGTGRAGPVSYPVLRKRERSLHTCAQDVQITCMATI